MTESTKARKAALEITRKAADKTAREARKVGPGSSAWEAARKACNAYNEALTEAAKDVWVFD